MRVRIDVTVPAEDAHLHLVAILLGNMGDILTEGIPFCQSLTNAQGETVGLLTTEEDEGGAEAHP